MPNYTTLAAVKKKALIPAIPQKLYITKLTVSEVDLKWNPISRASGYKIYRRISSSTKYVQVGNTSKASFKNIGLKSSTSYIYYVKAYNSHGISLPSKQVKAVIKKTATKAISKVVLGYATSYYIGDLSSYKSIVNNSTNLNQVITATFSATTSGAIYGSVPENQVEYANNNNIKVMAMVSNNFNGVTAKSILESSNNSQNLINNIISSLKMYNYKGVNIDFEGLLPSDRDYYSAFIKNLYNTLHPKGYIVSVAVPAKTTDNKSNTWSGAYDYSQIGKYSDSVILMAYDEHSPCDGPGPVASINWVQSVSNYALTTIPRNKIILGVAAYGYDWSKNGTKAYSIYGINALIAKYKITAKFDAKSKSPYFEYTDNNGVLHTVWYENSASLGYKLDIANNSNLSGIAIWRLGLETTDFWVAINTKFKV